MHVNIDSVVIQQDNKNNRVTSKLVVFQYVWLSHLFALLYIWGVGWNLGELTRTIRWSTSCIRCLIIISLEGSYRTRTHVSAIRLARGHRSLTASNWFYLCVCVMHQGFISSINEIKTKHVNDQGFNITISTVACRYQRGNQKPYYGV